MSHIVLARDARVGEVVMTGVGWSEITAIKPGVAEYHLILRFGTAGRCVRTDHPLWARGDAVPAGVETIQIGGRR